MYPECIKKIIESFKKLPGIGEKSAERMAFSVLGFEPESLDEFAEAIEDIKNIFMNSLGCMVPSIGILNQHVALFTLIPNISTIIREMTPII